MDGGFLAGLPWYAIRGSRLLFALVIDSNASKNYQFMSKISYSVAIRTLGNTGEKYLRLLQSIKSQTIQPEEIIVAIPDGYELDYQLGNERIIRCPKGMTHQRVASMYASKSKYTLVCDDDLEFGPTMVEELISYMTENNLNCCLPMSREDISNQESTIDLRYPLLTRIRSGFTGQLFTSRRKSKYLDILTYSAGHKVFIHSNNLDKCYLCTAACFQCFLIDTEFAKLAKYEEDFWLDEGRLTSYAAYDEPVFFSKLKPFGLRMAYALRVRYRHLDAKAGHITKTRLEDKRTRYYSIARNRTIYWHRCIWGLSTTCWQKVRALMGGLYSFTNYNLFTIAINLHPKYWPAINALFLGYKDAFTFIHK